MAAPRDIIDALECVLSIYFSSVRHRNRAAFILCDELVEMTCRGKAMQGDHTLGRVRFHDLLRHSGVGLDPKKITLGETISGTHTTRNHMQHANAAATVDEQHCADAILDAVAVIDHCFHGTSSGLSDSLKVMLRVVRLHSSNGNPAQRNAFDEAMRSHSWRGQRERAKFNESIVSPGMRVNWGLVIPGEYATVEYILNRLGVS